MSLTTSDIGIIISVISFSLLIFAGRNMLKEFAEKKKISADPGKGGASASASTPKVHEPVHTPVW